MEEKKEKSPSYVWDWEPEAQKNLPAPDGLPLADMMAYVILRQIYRDYRAGAISRETAAEEKKKLHRQWAQEAARADFDRKLSDYHTRLWKATESATGVYMKEKTIENADRLVRVMLGLREEV